MRRDFISLHSQSKFKELKFSEIVGQEEIVHDLIQQVKSDKIAHAQLFLERPGSGALKLALTFAQYINCENRSENDVCGSCSSCIKANKFEHPDIHFSFPSIAAKSGKPAISDDHISNFRKALNKNTYLSEKEWIKLISNENKSANITAEESRRILRKLNLKTYEGQYKIMIIWKPERLGKEGNILLKLIEEPPANTVILFVGEQSEMILPTVLSRTQIVKLKPIKASVIQNYLECNLNIESGLAKGISYQSEGNLNLAIQLAQNNHQIPTDIFRQWLNMIIKEQNGDLLKWCDQMHKDGRELIKNYLDYVLRFLDGFLYNALTGQGNSKLDTDEISIANKLTHYLSIDQTAAWMQLIEKKINHIERNGYAKLVLLDLSIKSMSILKPAPRLV